MSNEETPVVGSAASHGVTDAELEHLLQEVFIGGDSPEARPGSALLKASVVRELGEIIIARDPATRQLAGMVVVVPPTSLARRVAQANEAELRLLAVSPAHRGSGIGGVLIEAAREAARRAGLVKIILWTEPSAIAAQQLYLDNGFVRVPNRDWQQNRRQFLVFEAAL